MRCLSAKGTKILGYKNPPPGPGAAGILSPIYPREQLGPEGDNPVGTSVPSCPAQSGASVWGPPRFEVGILPQAPAGSRSAGNHWPGFLRTCAVVGI